MELSDRERQRERKRGGRESYFFNIHYFTKQFISSDINQVNMCLVNSRGNQLHRNSIKMVSGDSILISEGISFPSKLRIKIVKIVLIQRTSRHLPAQS